METGSNFTWVANYERPCFLAWVNFYLKSGYLVHNLVVYNLKTEYILCHWERPWGLEALDDRLQFLQLYHIHYFNKGLYKYTWKCSVCFAVIWIYVINASTFCRILLRKVHRTPFPITDSWNTVLHLKYCRFGFRPLQQSKSDKLFGFPVCINLCLHYVVVY